MIADRMKPDPEPSFHSVSDLAKRWDCSEKHVRRLIARKELVAHWFGNILRVSPDDRRRYERMNRMV